MKVKARSIVADADSFIGGDLSFQSNVRYFILAIYDTGYNFTFYRKPHIFLSDVLYGCHPATFDRQTG